MSLLTLESRRSVRSAQAKSVRESNEKAVERGGALNAPLNSNTNSVSVSEKLSDEKHQVSYRYGVIKYVLPTTDKISVVVEDIFPENEDHATHGPVYFNQFSHTTEEVPLLQVSIPLINVDGSMTDVDYNSYINKKVKVKLYDGITAVECELVSSTPYDSVHSTEITPWILQQAASFGDDPNRFLKTIGLTEDQIIDFNKLKIGSFNGNGTKSTGVIRFQHESYWDRDVSKSRDTDIVIPTKDKPEGLKDLNNLPMKDKLCHMPIIMFSAR